MHSVPLQFAVHDGADEQAFALAVWSLGRTVTHRPPVIGPQGLTLLVPVGSSNHATDHARCAQPPVDRLGVHPVARRPEDSMGDAAPEAREAVLGAGPQWPVL